MIVVGNEIVRGVHCSASGLPPAVGGSRVREADSPSLACSTLVSGGTGSSRYSVSS